VERYKQELGKLRQKQVGIPDKQGDENLKQDKGNKIKEFLGKDTTAKPVRPKAVKMRSEGNLGVPRKLQDEEAGYMVAQRLSRLSETFLEYSSEDSGQEGRSSSGSEEEDKMNYSMLGRCLCGYFI
jgi:hypothetical protein